MNVHFADGIPAVQIYQKTGKPTDSTVVIYPEGNGSVGQE